MGEKARQYTRTTIKRLFLLSCGECASPNCHNKLLAKDKISIIAKICHIEAASEGGARYNEKMTDDERRHFNNLFLLCDECHTIIDNKENEDKYPPELLHKWKKSHENYCRQIKFQKKPQILNTAINEIANLTFKDDNIEETNTTFNIENKIKFNSIKRNKFIIEEYSKYYGKINTLYSELEKQGSFKKEKLLRNINHIYNKIKSKYIADNENSIEIIQKNADNIFEAVETELMNIIDIEQSNNEDIFFALPIIMVDAFMRCKILEEPKKL